MSTLVNVQGKGPVESKDAGRFSVSIWCWRKTVPSKRGLDDDSAEKEVEVQRACIRFLSNSNNSESTNSNRIWCSVDDLRSLVQALDGLNFEDGQ